MHDDGPINFQRIRSVAWTGESSLFDDICSIAGQLTGLVISRPLFLQVAELCSRREIYAAPLFTFGRPSSSSA